MSWDRIRGHDAVVRRFETALAAGRLGQAYLFIGPEGIGKKRFAIELAKAMLCESDRHPLSACEQCTACKLVDAGTHPDLTVVGKPDDKTEFPIDTIRTLNNTLGLTPTRGGKKVAIVDDADFFNEESANAFLKTLEEPAPGTLMLLIGTSADVQLPTILSRCQLIRFERLTTDDVKSVLVSHHLPETDADRLARLAGGSPGKALLLNDPPLLDFRGVLLSDISASPFRRSALLESWLRFIEEAGKDAPAQRRRARLSIEFLLDFLCQCLRLAHGSDRTGFAGTDRDRANAFVGRLSPDRLLDAIDTIGQADLRIERRVPVNITIEALVDALGRVISANRM